MGVRDHGAGEQVLAGEVAKRRYTFAELTMHALLPICKAGRWCGAVSFLVNGNM
jgi:hypothetical protein